jgi:2-hydroxychromene-2-carboxylate isomerase
VRSDERRPRESGADANNQHQSTNPLRRVHEFERRWRREQPEEFEALALARAIGQVDRAIKKAADPQIQAELEDAIERARRRGVAA